MHKSERNDKIAWESERAERLRGTREQRETREDREKEIALDCRRKRRRTPRSLLDDEKSECSMIKEGRGKMIALIIIMHNCTSKQHNTTRAYNQ